MALKAIKTYLPELFHPLLPDIFSKEIPCEFFTDCPECHMICGSREETGCDESRPFSPETKCCTYIPHLPNFLAGGILCDPDSSLDHGRKVVRDRIRSRKGVFPHGVFPTKKYSLLYELGKTEGFGKSLTLKCPYYVHGKYNCALWKYREAVCATWFCKHVAQQSGRLFWDSVTKCMRYIEESLIAYVLICENLPFGHPFGENKNISYEDLDDLPMKQEEYQYRWGKWAGMEEKFYIRAYEHVAGLTRETFSDLMGINLQLLLTELEERQSTMMEIPEMMIADKSGTMTVIDNKYYCIELKTWIERNDMYVTHAMNFPSIIIDLFDGTRTTRENLQILKDKHGTELGEDILITLYQYGILKKI